MAEEALESDLVETPRKIIHIDMDCFYAAIEMRENPDLVGKPVAVGGSSRRGVLCTANYEAREFGCRSAMPVFKAKELCPELIIVPVQFDLYRAVSAQVRAVFERFTSQIEPLSLDEAYLDVSHWQSQAAAIAREIRGQILEETQLTASAGIAPNKMLAKIASDMEKPNGQFELTTEEVSSFMSTLPIGKLWGVGKKSQERLAAAGYKTCGQISRSDRWEVIEKLGRWGAELYEMSRGVDHRIVQPHRVRKSVSQETTLSEDARQSADLRPILLELLEGVRETMEQSYPHRKIKALVVKLKFDDFSQTTAERASTVIVGELAELLLEEGWSRGEGKSVRLLGFGVRLESDLKDEQLEMFEA